MTKFHRKRLVENNKCLLDCGLWCYSISLVQIRKALKLKNNLRRQMRDTLAMVVSTNRRNPSELHRRFGESRPRTTRHRLRSRTTRSVRRTDSISGARVPTPRSVPSRARTSSARRERRSEEATREDPLDKALTASNSPN